MDRTATKSVTCEECIEVLVDYVDGTMDAITVQAFERHFADCPPCVDFLKTYKATIHVSQKHFDESSVQVPQEVSHRLRNFLESRCKGKKPGQG